MLYNFNKRSFFFLTFIIVLLIFSPSKTFAKKSEKFLGDNNAKITIIEYASMTCDHCANFHKNIFPEIEKRNPNSKADDYLLFPNYKNRRTLYSKISKIFIRVSSELGLYHRNGATRPIYSIRHTFISNRYNDNAPLEVVARSANTSVKVVKKSYLDNEDTMMINEHKRLFPQSSMYSATVKKTKK